MSYRIEYGPSIPAQYRKKFDPRRLQVIGKAEATYLKGLTSDEKEIILDGCLMNYYAKRMD